MRRNEFHIERMECIDYTEAIMLPFLLKPPRPNVNCYLFSIRLCSLPNDKDVFIDKAREKVVHRVDILDHRSSILWLDGLELKKLQEDTKARICFDRDAWTFDHIHAILRIKNLSDSFLRLKTSISCYGVDAITSDISISVMKSQLFISLFERFFVGESRNLSPGTVTAIDNQSDWQCTYLRALQSSNLPSALHRFQSEESSFPFHWPNLTLTFSELATGFEAHHHLSPSRSHLISTTSPKSLNACTLHQMSSFWESQTQKSSSSFTHSESDSSVLNSQLGSTKFVNGI
ncbi:unnamed protein product [Albugo candida]|uniref:Uncharacterized protein n=1 Tax=Albugo candida TaxID=65357 RepID=A0A024GIR2_9STRA|nr:unnamed protein product [Albugo candida]|eukprot:CCI46234.1 unnamed protein product [Albugo candida]